MTTPLTASPELSESQADKEETANETFRRIESGAGFFQIVDKDLTAPPGSSADGARYIVGAGATGAWSGHDGDIAYSNGVDASNGWYFRDAAEGLFAWVADENLLYYYDGAAWAPFAAPGGYTDEQAQDAVGTILTDTGLAVVTYDDGAPSIDINVPAAAASDLNTGTDATKAVTSDAFAGSSFGIRYIAFVLNGTTALTTSDKAYQRIPAAYNGMNLVTVAGAVGTGAAGSSSSGTPTFTVKNVTDNNQMLSTSLTVDANEYTSATAATPAVIDTTKDDVVTDDLIEVACTVAGTGVTYATVTLGFQLP